MVSNYLQFLLTRNEEVYEANVKTLELLEKSNAFKPSVTKNVKTMVFQVEKVDSTEGKKVIVDVAVQIRLICP